MVTGMDIKYEGRTRQGEQKMSFINYKCFQFFYSVEQQSGNYSMHVPVADHGGTLVMALKQGNKLIR